MDNGKLESQTNSERERIMSTGHTNGINLIEVITSLAHICIIGYAAFLLYLCFASELLFFTWHPILLGIGWALLMTEGVLILSSNNIFTRSLPHKTKIQLHWIMETAAVTLSVVGFIFVAINKNRGKKPHFFSWHAIIGLVSLIVCVPTCISGITALYNTSLKDYIKPANNKFIHRISGTFTFLMGLVTILLSFYTHWYVRKSQSTAVFLVLFIAIAFSYVWTLRSSFLNIYKRVAVLLS